MSSHPLSPPRGAQDLLSLAPALDEGKGTAYERYALDRFLEELARRLEIRTALEMPANGVMGVPGIKSLALACRGIQVTLAVPAAPTARDVRALWAAIGLDARVDVEPYGASKYPGGHFDLVWNFCVLEHLEDPRALVREMLRVSRGFVLLFTQNPYNPGIAVHRGIHALSEEPWDHGDLGQASLAAARIWLQESGATIVEEGAVDCPPWPDINMRLAPAADTLPERSPPAVARYRPSVRRRSVDEIVRRIRRIRRLCAEDAAQASAAIDPWPYLYRAWSHVERRMPKLLLRYAAHHPYVLARVARPT